MVSYKGKQMLMMDSEIPLVVYLAKKDEYICPPKDLYTNVSNGTIHTCQKLETDQISINRTDKQTVAYDELPLNNKIEPTTSC